MQVVHPIRKEYQLGKKKASGKSRWQATRRRWIRENPPDYMGYYYCQILPCIMNNRPMLTLEMSLDHILKRGTHPDKIHDLNNLRPAHWECNVAREQ